MAPAYSEGALLMENATSVMSSVRGEKATPQLHSFTQGPQPRDRYSRLPLPTESHNPTTKAAWANDLPGHAHHCS